MKARRFAPLGSDVLPACRRAGLSINLTHFSDLLLQLEPKAQLFEGLGISLT